MEKNTVDDKIKYYEEFVSTFPKLTIKEMEECLPKKTQESKNLFLNSFIHYIYRIAVKLYHLNEEYFNAYYDFEEFFNDGIVTASELFMRPDLQFSSFQVYNKFFNQYFAMNLAKTYFLHIGVCIWYQNKEIILAKMHNRQICSDYTPRIINSVKNCEYFEDLGEIPYEFEDEILQSIVDTDFKKDISFVLQQFPVEKRNVLFYLFGLADFPRLSQRALAKREGVSYQTINNEYHKALNDFMHHSLIKKKYL